MVNGWCTSGLGCHCGLSVLFTVQSTRISYVSLVAEISGWLLFQIEACVMCNVFQWTAREGEASVICGIVSFFLLAVLFTWWRSNELPKHVAGSNKLNIQKFRCCDCDPPLLENVLLCSSGRCLSGVFAKLRKATFNFVLSLSICPSFCMEQLGFHWTDFHETSYWVFFKKSARQFKFH